MLSAIFLDLLGNGSSMTVLELMLSKDSYLPGCVNIFACKMLILKCRCTFLAQNCTKHIWVCDLIIRFYYYIFLKK